MSKKPYRSLVGSLLYACQTRPDIAVAVSELCKHMDNPGYAMWQAAKRVCRYLQGTINTGILISSTPPLPGKEISAWVDASFADCPDTRRSRWGNLIYYGNTLISWKTKLQTINAHSTAEAEYRAASHTCRDIVWLRYLLEEIGQKQEQVPIQEDNHATIRMVENPMASQRNKHIENDCHYIRECYKRSWIKLLPVDTNNNRAGMLTKALEKTKFSKFAAETTTS